MNHTKQFTTSVIIMEQNFLVLVFRITDKHSVISHLHISVNKIVTFMTLLLDFSLEVMSNYLCTILLTRHH